MRIEYAKMRIYTLIIKISTYLYDKMYQKQAKKEKHR